jgi:L,D-peptidoglycan transpeptidase YkuD (ErfK/YbiS/YcfS/YnhG family)
MFAILPVQAEASVSSIENKIINRLNKLPNGQALVVVTSHAKARSGTLFFYEKQHRTWRKVFAPIRVVVGKNGIGKQKEGDGKTPAGIYPLGIAFGTAKKPAGLKIPYRKTTAYDYWVDDPSSKDYNRWVYYRGNPYRRWKSFERLAHPLYKYAIVIRYNDNPVVKGKGSAIFLHIWPRPSGYTLGCIAMAEKDLLAIMKRLDAKKKPVILINEQRKW